MGEKMSISKLPKNIEEFINQGGTASTKNNENKKDDEESCRIILRMPKRLLVLLDEVRNQRPSKPFRNQLILELLDSGIMALLDADAKSKL